MDPYLEGELWQEFHETLANQLRAQLLGTLPSRYVALLSKRYVVNYSGLSILDLPSQQVIYPDVHVVERPPLKEVATLPYTAVTAPTLELLSPIPEKAPVLSVEIRDVAERRLVTVIEILSPANKHGRGLRDYSTRRAAILQTQTHLLEIDLLRGGERISFVGGELPTAAYFVFLSRYTRRPHTEVWPIALRNALPTVPVPLLPPDADVPLSLQAAIDACFALVGYERLIDYTQPPPPPPLSPQDLAWVRDRTRQPPTPSP